MLKVTCINNANTSSTAGGQHRLMAEDEVEEGEEGEERLLSVLSMVSALSNIVTSTRSHQREAALALSRQHRWKAAMTMQMQM